MTRISIASLLLAASLFTLPAAAQIAMPGGAPGAMKQAPKMGKIYGKIVDAKSGKAIDLASVVLLEKKSGKQALVKGANTESNGEFSLDELPMFGQFELVITAMGYKEYRQPVGFDMGALMKAGQSMRGSGSGEMSIPDGAGAALAAINKDLGNIRLEAAAQSLEGVTVKGSVPQFMLQGEKKIFNVEQNQTSQGGTAADVMKNVPGVLVDADNKVTIRNAAPQILIDGRQSPLTLDQIPSDAIESVEVITNPSAKYDAEGGVGGVLNIVLKKNRKKGYNGNLRAGVDSRGGGNLGGDFNTRSGKFNVSAMGFANLHRNYTTAQTERLDLSTNPDLRTYQDDVNKTSGAFMLGRLGLDYFMTNRTTLSVSGIKMHGEFKPDSRIDISIDSLLAGGERYSYGRRVTSGNNTFDMNGGSFGIKHLFPKAGQEWTFDANVHSGRNTNDNVYAADYFADGARSQSLYSLNQRLAGSGRNAFYTIQTDYTQPLANKAKLDMGLKATIRNVESNIYNYRDSSGSWLLIDNPNSNYEYLDQVYAAYGSYSGNWGENTSFQLGLRAESSNYTGELSRRDTSFTIQYPVSLFPSVFVSRKLPQDQQLQFSYRRGINRPNFFQLLPFTDYTDPLNIRQGNPALRPEFTNSVELNYMKNFTKSNYVMISLYERHSDNLITAYQSLGINPFSGEQAIISSYINANSSDKYGAEITSSWDIAKWWTAVANVNLYNAVISTGEATTLNGTYFSGFGKLNNQFKYKKWSAQLSGAYQSRTNLLPDTKNDGFRGGGGPHGQQTSSTAQGYMGEIWYVDVSVRRSFLKNDAATISLSVNDVFASRKFVQHTENAYFIQDYTRLVNPQLVRLNFSWRFGKLDTEIFRRKNIRGQMEGMQEAGQGMM